MAATLNQPLKWHGGKNYLANWIVSLMPPHLNYVEPYFGGGAVLFARDPDDERFWLPGHKGVSEVINDLNGGLTNFWRVLRDSETFAHFHRLVEATPFSGIEFNRCRASLVIGENADLVVRAWEFFVVNRMSLAGRMKDFTGVTKTRTRARMNNETSAWLSCIDGLPVVHARLQRVLVLPSQPALKVIEKFNARETLLYLDPPYLHETRVTTDEYLHEMTEADHRELLDTICLSSAHIMLSGYANELYDRTLYDWNRHTFTVPNQASHAREKPIMEEVLWCNF